MPLTFFQPARGVGASTRPPSFRSAGRGEEICIFGLYDATIDLNNAGRKPGGRAEALPHSLRPENVSGIGRFRLPSWDSACAGAQAFGHEYLMRARDGSRRVFSSLRRAFDPALTCFGSIRLQLLWNSSVRKARRSDTRRAHRGNVVAPLGRRQTGYRVLGPVAELSAGTRLTGTKGT
jgi:hypothetical protein